VICQVVYKVLILSVQSQRLKENLKQMAWGLDVVLELDSDDTFVKPFH